MKSNCSDCCYPDVVDTKACGCCEGIASSTPLPTSNRPGLSQLSYRIGTHASFLETMIARLSNSDFPQLAGLTTRDTEDPSIALLDGWATVAEVLTFYQERIANEGYLRTATERRSILELARLVGYKLRPGVSSSVFLAFTIEEQTEGEATIPAGSRAQSVPGPGELPQSFETVEDTKARAQWNSLKPRMTQPQTSESIFRNSLYEPRIYLKGISSNVKTNDPLLISLGPESPSFFLAREVIEDTVADRTLVTLQTTLSPTGEGTVVGASATASENHQIQLIKELTRPASLQPANSTRLDRRLADQFKSKAEAGYKALGAFAPSLRHTLATAASNAKVTPDNTINAYALRRQSALFGNNHPGAPGYVRDESGMITISGYTPPTLTRVWPPHMLRERGLKKIAIDPPEQQLSPGSWIVINRPILDDECTPAGWTHSVHKVSAANPATLSSFGASSKVSLLEIEPPWLRDIPDEEFKVLTSCESLLRDTSVYCLSEELEITEEPIVESVCGGSGQSLELDGFYEGLESGRWIIVSGERDIADTSGVRFSELAMIASVTHDVLKPPTAVDDPEETHPRDGEKTHTFITLAEELQYCFKRDTVTIYGNVAKATHGETRREVLGSGDGGRALQSFELKQSPLTHVAASNPTGVETTLSVFVNDIRWHEVDALAGLQKADRNFLTRTDDDSKTSIIFGNGREGARLPTGVENIRTEYRNGIGRGGNVNAEQISMLTTRPLGVKEVINPLRASGGADRENRDQARKSAPLAVKALDRLVSVQDYEDFARLYAGIGKSAAIETSNGRQQVVHVSVAGADDIPIDETSDLFLNLRQALYESGDPFQSIELAVRELKLIAISANIHIEADHQWEAVETQVRAALLEAFSFEQQELGQDVALSEVISVTQAVPGVNYVDVDTFGGIPEKQPDEFEPGKRRLLSPDEIADRVQQLIDKAEKLKRPEPRLSVNRAELEDGVIRPAQLAFLTPDVPDTLILNQIK